MNIVKLLSNENIETLSTLSTEVIQIIKKNKMYLKAASEFSIPRRVMQGESLIQLYRAFTINADFGRDVIEESEASNKVKVLIFKMAECLEGDNLFKYHTFKEFAKGAEVKLSRDCVPHLELAFINSEIDIEFIKNFYEVLGKPIPRKFAGSIVNLDPKFVKLLADIKSKVTVESSDIKIRLMEHYKNMVIKIDPENEFKTRKEFIDEGKRKISNMYTLRLCLAYKFKNETFMNLVDEDFNMLINVAASRIIDHVSFDSNVEILDLRIGNKGFDIKFETEKAIYRARAITAEGPFVRFHYRFIIT